MVLEVVEAELEDSLGRSHCIGIIPLLPVSIQLTSLKVEETNLFISRDTIPEVDSLEERVVIIIERATRHVELVRELM